MRKSLERRVSRSSSSFSTQRGSADMLSSRHASPRPEVLSAEELARRRAESRRSNLQAVWGEEVCLCCFLCCRLP